MFPQTAWWAHVAAPIGFARRRSPGARTIFRAGPEIRCSAASRYRHTGALAGSQRSDNRGASARPDRRPAAPAGLESTADWPGQRRKGRVAPDLSDAGVGRLSIVGLRRDPHLWRDILAGHAPLADRPARPRERDSARAANGGPALY